MRDAKETFRQIDLVVDSALKPAAPKHSSEYLRSIRDLIYAFTRRTLSQPNQGSDQPKGEPLDVQAREGELRCSECSQKPYSTLTDQCPHCGAKNYGHVEPKEEGQ